MAVVCLDLWSTNCFFLHVEVQEKSESAPMDFDCMSNFYGKLPKERQAFLKAHRPWLYNQYMHSKCTCTFKNTTSAVFNSFYVDLGKRFIRSEVRKHFPIATTFASAGEQEKLEGLVKNLESKCSVPEIGFGLGT